MFSQRQRSSLWCDEMIYFWYIFKDNFKKNKFIWQEEIFYALTNSQMPTTMEAGLGWRQQPSTPLHPVLLTWITGASLLAVMDFESGKPWRGVSDMGAWRRDADVVSGVFTTVPNAPPQGWFGGFSPQLSSISKESYFCNLCFFPCQKP